MMLQAYHDREDRDRRWDLDRIRLLARIWGVEVPAPPERTLTRQQKHDLLRRLGGTVEVH